MKGKVYLVGAGPGDPELLTVKALRLLREADAVLYDDLVSPEILNLIPSTSELHNVGKRSGVKKIQQEEINFLMIALAESGLKVIRLKSGDPLIFGRAGEEMEALRRAGIDYEIVPGITSALGAAASAQIPLTHRRASSSVVLLAGHQAEGSDPEDWSKLAGGDSTLVIYMPGRSYDSLAKRLEDAGLSAETPCAVISQATTPREKVHRTTIGGLPKAPHLTAPMLLVVGEVVRQSDVTVSEFASSSATEGYVHLIWSAGLDFEDSESKTEEESFA
jgi:uroporphyrin-III C-methyltransferase